MKNLFAIGGDKEKEKSFEKFDKKLEDKLGSAATAQSWSDLLPIIKDINLFLSLNKEYDFNNITNKLLLGKRLAQGLNPECPNGLHDITIDVYEILLNNIISRSKDKLMDNLYIYSYGLFPFFPNASLQIKKKFLEKIVKNIFTKLNSAELQLCLPGLLSSLIPGLDDNNEEVTRLIYECFGLLRGIEEGKQERNFFGVYWMLLLRNKHLRNSGIKYLLEKTNKYSYIQTLENKEKQKKIIINQFPNINTTIVNALSEIIKDNEIQVVRNGLDFIITRLPLTKENTILSDRTKINLIYHAFYLFIKNEHSATRRLKSWLIGLDDTEDEVDFNSDDMKYKMGLIIEAFKIVFKQDKAIDPDVIKNDILIFERFVDLREEFIYLILPNIAELIIKLVVNYWEEELESSETKEDDKIISQITNFFNKKELFKECLWKSLANSINDININNNIDEIISPLKFCLIYINIKSSENRIKYYVPIIINLLKVLKNISFKKDLFKQLRRITLIALSYTKFLQLSEFYEKEDEKEIKNKNIKENNNILYRTKTLKEVVLDELINNMEDANKNNNIVDVYKISNSSNKSSLLNYDENLYDDFSSCIEEYQIFYIKILNEFLISQEINSNKNKNGQISKYEISFFRQISELTLRLQEYSQSEENEIPNWIKYLEKIIFNFKKKNNKSENLLSIEAANILLDLNLSFSLNNKIYSNIRNNFHKENVDNQIIDMSSINNIVNKMKVKQNCYELLIGKYYLYSNKQTNININMDILLKLFYFDKNKFVDIIDNTLNIKENLDENIKLFSNFWKLSNEYYPEEKLFKEKTILKMIDFLEDKNPRLRHLSKTWLNQANQQFSKIIDPILLVLLNKKIYFSENEEKGFTEFINVFDTSFILDALNKLRNIIINSQIMSFLKEEKNECISDKINFDKYSSKKMNYLQIIISIVLHFIRTKAGDGLSEEFTKDIFSVNVAATEFLEFLIKNINDFDCLIKNIDFINSTIFTSLKYYLEQGDEIMPIELLDVLKHLYFYFPSDTFKDSKKKSYFIHLLMNKNLIEIINSGMIFDQFYIRDHFISFTKNLVKTFFNVISIKDKEELNNFYQLCNHFINPLSELLKQKVTYENNIKNDTENFSHFNEQHNKIIFKNYCEEYKEYKYYDESEVLSILKGIDDIIENCSKNQIQEKNKEMGTDKGITFFYIPIPFIKKKVVTKMEFEGDWKEYKRNLANDLKTNNAFVSFFTTAFDFIDENPNDEIKDMSTKLNNNQIVNLLSSFLAIWVNQSDKYERYDYCLNSNGILAPSRVDVIKTLSSKKILQAKENIKNNPIKNIILRIAYNLFITDSIKFIENIILLWSQDNLEENPTIKDKQYKLSLIELLIAMEVPIDIILFCTGVYLQKTFTNNDKLNKYIKNKSDKCYIIPMDIGIKEAKIFHFIYSYLLLNPNKYSINKENTKNVLNESKNEISEIWKEIINIMNNTINESKIIYTFCWLYEILQLSSQKFSLSGIDNREIRSGIDNIFNAITNKLIGSVFSKKYESKFINNEKKLVLPFLPRIYTNIVKEIYKGENLYHKNLEGNNRNSFRSNLRQNIIDDNSDKKQTIFKKVESDIINQKLKTITHKNTELYKTDLIKKGSNIKTINEFYLYYINISQFSSVYYSSKVTDKIENENIFDVNEIYQKLAFIILKENFYILIKKFYGDNFNSVKKYYNDIINKLLNLIKNSENRENFFVELSHKFLADLMESSPKNISTCGKEILMEYIKSPMLFKGTPSQLHNWKKIIKYLAKNYKEILDDLLDDMIDKNIFVKKSEEEKSKILRRVSFVIYSCKTDFFRKKFILIKTKVKEFLSEFSSDKFLEREIFLLLRMLFLKFTHDAVMQMIRDLWPIIFTEMIKDINSYIKKERKVDSIIEPFKFVELLSLVNIEEFSLYQWIFIIDTFDINDCDIMKDSLIKTLYLDTQNNGNLFKPFGYKIIEEDFSIVQNEKFLKSKNKGKNELFIIDKGNFKNNLKEFFYSVGDMNSYKIKANYDQIKSIIEKDFID